MPDVTVVQIMNRAPIAHLAIERAIKFLIEASGGKSKKTHTLNQLCDELKQLDPGAEAYLSYAFDDAVSFYGYNTNAHDFKHLKSLNQYFEETGTQNAFQKMRYWELDPELKDVLIRRVSLDIHREILCAIRQLLDSNTVSGVTHRVDTLVRSTINSKMIYSDQQTERKKAIHTILAASDQGKSWLSILFDAVQSGFDLGDNSLNVDIYKAYRQLLQHEDPAVRYYADKCSVLQNQPRAIMPEVEWYNQNDTSGRAHTPMGTTLGFVKRGFDGMWFATAAMNTYRVRAQTLADARAYLGNQMSSSATVVVNDEIRQLRLVGREGNLIQGEEATTWTRDVDPNQAYTYVLEFWDDQHGIEVGQCVRIEVHDSADSLHQLEGAVSLVQAHKVTVSGRDVYAVPCESYLNQLKS